MLRKLLHHARGNVVAYLALFFALTGTATALSGSNTVFSDDITDNEVRSEDVRNDNLSGGDVRVNALDGADINESRLGTVPSARLGGIGRSAAKGNCNPESQTDVTCVFTTLNLPAPARVLVTASTRVGTTDSGSGWCTLVSNKTGAIPGSSKHVTAEDEGGVANGGDGESFTAVTPVQPSGSVDFGLECDESAGKVDYGGNSQVSAVALSAE